MDLNEIFSNLKLADTNVALILDEEINSIYLYTRAINRAIHCVDTLVDYDLRTSALTKIACCCLELYKWLLPYSNGIMSSDFEDLRLKYKYDIENVKLSSLVLVNISKDFETTGPTKQCSMATIMREILSDITPKLDSWTNINN